MVYLDNAATTAPCEAAVNAVHRTMTEHFGNPSSLHKLGVKAEEEIENARKTIAASIGTAPESLYFTSGATESNASLIKGAWKSFHRHKNRIVISSVEHPSVAEAANVIKAEGAEVIVVHPDENGVFRIDDFAEAVNDKTFLCSVMTVNNETGAILPIKQIFGAVKRKNPECITHTDAVAAFMKIPLRVSDMCADAMTVSAHKIHGIKGCGALYIKKGVRIIPLITGGGQERGFRSGTQAVPAIAAFGAATETMRTDMENAYNTRCELAAYLKEKLAALPYITINSPAESSPYIINFSVKQIRSEIMLHYLETREIYVSSGSACSSNSGNGKKHNVLREFGVSGKAADEALRVSMSVLTTKRDLETLIDGLQAGYEAIQKTR
jgi:cysteine desulfurase